MARNLPNDADRPGSLPGAQNISYQEPAFPQGPMGGQRADLGGQRTDLAREQALLGQQKSFATGQTRVDPTRDLDQDRFRQSEGIDRRPIASLNQGGQLAGRQGLAQGQEQQDFGRRVVNLEETEIPNRQIRSKMGGGEFQVPVTEIQLGEKNTRGQFMSQYEEAANLHRVELNTTKVVQVPTKEVVEVPSTEMREIVETKTIEVPSTKTIEVPTTNFVEVPTTKFVEVHGTKKIEVPTTKRIEVPVVKHVEVPTTRTVEVESTKFVSVPAKEIVQLAPGAQEGTSRVIGRETVLVNPPQDQGLDEATRGVGNLGLEEKAAKHKVKGTGSGLKHKKKATSHADEIIE